MYNQRNEENNQNIENDIIKENEMKEGEGEGEGQEPQTCPLFYKFLLILFSL